MDEKDLQLLAGLLADRRVATLALTIEGAPFASLVPFAMTEGNEVALIHASALAQHSKGLKEGARYSLLVHEPDTQAETNPAQLGRVTLSGTVQPLTRDGEEYSKAKHRYLDKFPKSQITFQLGDFTLYGLRVDHCRFVAGFGKAFDVTLSDLAELT